MTADLSFSGEAPPEALMLLASARALHDEAALEQVAAQARNVADWDGLRQLAEWHGLTPLLHKSLAETDPAQMPPGEKRALRQSFLTSVQHSLVLGQELLNVLHLFEAEGIAAVPLKGPVFAAWTYGNAAYRFSSDLDLLVSRADLPAARALLHAEGYLSWWQHDPDGEIERVESQVGGEFFHADTRVCVELHWTFLNTVHAFPMDPASVRERLIEVPFGDRSVPSLAPEDLLQYLCAHGSKHCWECLRWIVDIAQLVRTCPDLDWPRVIRQARRLRCRRMVGLGLHLAHRLLDLALPAEAVRQLTSDPAVHRLARQVQEALFSLDVQPFTERERMRFHLAVREDVRDRWPYYQHMIRLALQPSKKDRAFVALPEFLTFLYPLIRPFRLARNGMARLMKLSPGGGTSTGG